MMSIRGTLYELLAEGLVSADGNCARSVMNVLSSRSCDSDPCVRRSGSESRFEDPDGSETPAEPWRNVTHHAPDQSPRQSEIGNIKPA